VKIISSDYDYIFGEDEPTCRTIITEDDKWFVSLPYVTYMCQKIFRERRNFIKLFVSFRRRSTKKLNTHLLYTGLPNIGDDGSVCMGNVFATTVFDFDSLEQAIKEMVGKFWMSKFTLNEDEWEGVSVIFRHFRCKHDEVGSNAGFREWQRASKKDSNYGMKIKWPPLYRSPFKLFTHRSSLSWQDRIDYASHGHRKNTREARERAGIDENN